MKIKRKQVLALLRIAGYENDKARFTRLYIEHRISMTVAMEAWRAGVRLREAAQ